MPFKANKYESPFPNLPYESYMKVMYKNTAYYKIHGLPKGCDTEPKETVLLQTRLATSKDIRNWCVRGRFTEEAWDFGINPEELFPKVETKKKSRKKSKRAKIQLTKPPTPRQTNYTFSTKGSGITAETLKYKTYQPEPKGLFCEYYFGPVEGGRCPKCGWTGPITQSPQMSCPNASCGYPSLETRITRRSQMGYIRLAIPCIHPWYAFTWASPLSTFLGIEPNLLQLIFDFEAYLVHLRKFCDYCMVPPDLLLAPRFSTRQLTSKKWITQVTQKKKLRDPISWRELLWEPSQWKFIYQFWVGVKTQRKLYTRKSKKKDVEWSSDLLKTELSLFWSEYEEPSTYTFVKLFSESELTPNLTEPVSVAQSHISTTTFGSGGNAISSILNGLPKDTKYFYPALFEQWISEPKSNSSRFDPNQKSRTTLLSKGRGKPTTSVLFKNEMQTQTLAQLPFSNISTSKLSLPNTNQLYSKQWKNWFTIATKLQKIHTQTLLYQGDLSIHFHTSYQHHYRALWRSLLQWNIIQEQTLLTNANVSLSVIRSNGDQSRQTRMFNANRYRTNIEALYKTLIPVQIGKLTVRTISQRSRLTRSGQKSVVQRSYKNINHWGRIPFGRMLVWHLWFHYTDQLHPFSALSTDYPAHEDEVRDDGNNTLTKKSYRYDEIIEVVHSNTLKWKKGENNYRGDDTGPNLLQTDVLTQTGYFESDEIAQPQLESPLRQKVVLDSSKTQHKLPLRLLQRPVKHSRPKLGNWVTFKSTQNYPPRILHSVDNQTNRKPFSLYQLRKGYRFSDKVEKLFTTSRRWPSDMPTKSDDKLTWTPLEWEITKQTHQRLSSYALSNRPTFEDLMLQKWVKDAEKPTPIFQATYRLLVMKATRSWMRRYRLLEHLQRGLVDPDALILKRLPLLPPTLRPILRLRVGQGRLATSDINFLYRTVILRNNSIQEHVARKFDFDYPELMSPLGLMEQSVTFMGNPMGMSALGKDSWMLGKGASRPTGAVLGNYMMAHFRRALLGVIENSKLGKKAFRPGNWRQAHPTTEKLSSTSAQKSQLVSLADTLKGKYGLLRRHMLGKRADYSGRTVIVAGPELALEECGLPYDMALGLFRPFLIHTILRDRKAGSIGGAKRLLQSCQTATYRLLESLIEHHPILLNRAPTLHRMGIQAFTPVLVPGFAVHLHPLVCPPFNADFDGDTMAIHLPMSHVARAEAHVLLSGSLFPVSPSSGDGSLLPSQDIVLGCFALTQLQGDDPLEKLGVGQVYSQPQTLIQGLEMGMIATSTSGWITWTAPPQGEVKHGAPKELRVQPGGIYQTIYPFYSCILKQNGQLLTSLTKTTPGYALIQRALTSGLL